MTTGLTAKFLRLIPPSLRFAAIYRLNLWGDRESRSGAGSNAQETEHLVVQLERLLDRLRINTVLDVPCGDLHWMRNVKFDGLYIGGDIVSDIVRRNQALYACEQRKFIKLDLTKDALPDADLILSRDCLVHLPNDRVLRALRNIARSRCRYALLTSFSDRRDNVDISTGAWRPLNLCAPPFSLPPPLETIQEQPADTAYRDKYLGLWSCQQLA